MEPDTQRKRQIGISRRRGSRTDPDVLAAIQERASEGWKAAAIQRDLDGSDEFAGRVPTARTIQAIVQGTRSRTDEAWSLIDSDPDDLRFALPAMRELFANSGGRIGAGLSTGVVRWIARLRRADPEIPAAVAFRLAIGYRHAERTQKRERAREEDRKLVTRPWRRDQ